MVPRTSANWPEHDSKGESVKFLTSTRVRTTALLGAGLALLAGGIAYAAIPDASGVIHGCYKKTSPNQGTLRVIDTEKGQKCLSSETTLTWNQTGPQGPTGPQGSTGPQGPAGPSAAFATIVDGPVAAPAGGPTTVASLSIPQAGDYVVSSKMFLTFDNSAFTSVVYECDLQAGSDVDVTRGSTGGE